MRCIVITPIPTVPANQGNAVNIARLNQCLQASGCEVHMVYSAMEGMADWQVQGMSAHCDSLDVLPFRTALPPPGIHGNRLDDWFDPAVSRHVRELCRTQRYDFALIHYVWMTAVCRELPPDLPTFLFTHDRFGNRHEMLARSGIAPTWYSISPVDEAAGLQRVDRIIATQETEAEYFRSIANRPVDVLGSIQALRNRPKRISINYTYLSAGYIGSANPGNRKSMRLLIDAIDRSPTIDRTKFKLVLAGPISYLPEMQRPYVSCIGQVGCVEDLFRLVDVVLNPSIGGSGLKIKSVESLAAGMPLVSTIDGMMGLPLTHGALACATIEQFVEALTALHDPAELNRLSRACRTSIETYASGQVHAFRTLFGADQIASLGAHKRSAAA